MTGDSILVKRIELLKNAMDEISLTTVARCKICEHFQVT